MKERDNGSVLTGVMANDRPENMEKTWFPLSNLSLNKWASLQFIRYMTKMQVEFEKEVFVSVLTRVMAFDSMNNLSLNDHILL